MNADLHISVFHAVGALPVHAAREAGVFSSHGLGVSIEKTRNSTELMEGLLDGRFQIVHAAPDNAIAWADRTGGSVRAWIGGSAGPLTLTARPEMTSIKDLQDQPIGVDALTSGFVSLLRVLLRAGGLGDDDYELVPIGATPLRLRALVAGEIAATLLSIPSSIIAEGAGMRALSRHSEVLAAYQSYTGISTTDWLDRNPELATSYVAALVSSIDWLRDRANRPRAVELTADLLDIGPEEAAHALDLILEPDHGWPSDARVDERGMEEMARIRAETFGPPQQPITHYIDTRPTSRLGA